MAATIDQTRAIDALAPVAADETEVSDARRIARYCALEELPGLILGGVTAVYIVSSLAGLVL